MNLRSNEKARSVGVALSLSVFQVASVVVLSVPLVLVLGTGVTSNLALGGAINVASMVAIVWGYLYATGQGTTYLDFVVLDATTLRNGLVTGVVLVAVQVVAEVLFGALGISPASIPYDQLGLPTFLVLAVVLVVLTPPAEELFYRNVVQKRLDEQFETGYAIAGASFLFAAYHAPNYVGEPLPAVVASLSVVFVEGGILGYAYARSRNLYVPTFGHALTNLTAVGVTYARLFGV